MMKRKNKKVDEKDCNSKSKKEKESDLKKEKRKEKSSGVKYNVLEPCVYYNSETNQEYTVNIPVKLFNISFHNILNLDIWNNLSVEEKESLQKLLPQHEHINMEKKY